MVTQICVNIGSGNGLVPSGTKPLPEPMLTQIYFTIHQCWLFLGEILWHSSDCKFTWVSRIQYNEVENYTHISVAIKLNIWCNELHTYAYHKRFHFIQSTHTRYPIPPLWGWKWDFFFWFPSAHSWLFHNSDVTWASWHLKSPATQLFVQQIVLANMNESINTQHYWLFYERNPLVTIGFPSQRVSNSESVTMLCHHHHET